MDIFWPEGSNTSGSNNIHVITWEKKRVYSGPRVQTPVDSTTYIGKGTGIFWLQGSNTSGFNNIHIITWEKEWIYFGLRCQISVDPTIYVLLLGKKSSYILAWKVNCRWIQYYTCYYMGKKVEIFWPEGSITDGSSNYMGKGADIFWSDVYRR